MCVWLVFGFFGVLCGGVIGDRIVSIFLIRLWFC